MRSLTLVTVLLIVSSLVPIGLWLAMAASVEPAGIGRSIGRAILVVLSPSAFAGLLMIAGAVMLHHTPQAARIVATIGTAVVLVAGLGAGAMLARSYANCGGAGCGEELVRAVAAFAYALAQIGLIALIWRVRATMPPAG